MGEPEDVPRHDESELATNLRWLLETVGGRAAVTASVTLLAFAIHAYLGLVVGLGASGWTLALALRGLARRKPDPIVDFERERAERAALVFKRASPEDPAPEPTTSGRPES